MVYPRNIANEFKLKYHYLHISYKSNPYFLPLTWTIVIGKKNMGWHVKPPYRRRNSAFIRSSTSISWRYKGWAPKRCGEAMVSVGKSSTIMVCVPDLYQFNNYYNNDNKTTYYIYICMHSFFLLIRIMRNDNTEQR